jgi:hypothetical protein
MRLGQLPLWRLSIHGRAFAVLERELEWANLTIQKRDAQIRTLEERHGLKARLRALSGGSIWLDGLNPKNVN